MSALAICLLALGAAPPTGADVTMDGDTRILRIRACADEELRARDAWREEIGALLEFASNIYEKTFDIRLDLVETVEWESDDAGEGMGDLVDELETEISLDGADVVIGFSAQTPRRGKLSKYIALPWGLTPSLGRASMIRAMVDDETYDLHLATVHEIAHLFGAFHVARQDSVMRESVEGPRTFQFDTENGKLMRLMRTYDFEAGVEGLTPAVSQRITNIWKRGAVKHDSSPLAEALYNRGVERISADDTPGAIELWLRAAEADAGFAGVRGSLGLAYAELGEFEEALGHLADADELGWPNARQVIQYVTAMRENQNKHDASPDANKASAGTEE